MAKTVIVALFMLLLLSACGAQAGASPVRDPSFHTGKFMLKKSATRALQFNKDGTWNALDGTRHMADGTYTVSDGVYTETSNDQGCAVPRHYKFTFDGNNLVFHPVEDATKDTCMGRRIDFGETSTWVLSQ